MTTSITIIVSRRCLYSHFLYQYQLLRNSFTQIPPSSTKTSGQSTKKGGSGETLTQPSPAMKGNCERVCCLVDVLMQGDVFNACALLKRAWLQTRFLGLLQKQDFNLQYTAPWPLGVEVRKKGSVTVLFMILNYYFITGTIMYISEHVISTKSQF